MDLLQAKHHLTGPVMSLRTPFKADGEIDYDGVAKIIDTTIEAGSSTIMLTAGDSHYDILSDEEIISLTKFTIKHTANRAMNLVADRYLSTSRAVEFAKVCKNLGADMIMPLPPDWGHSCTPKTLAQHYSDIAKVMPVMIVTNRFIQRGIPFGIETIERSLQLSSNILAIKDDMCGTFAHDLCMQFSDHLAIIAGGQKRNHLNMWPYGCSGYLSTLIIYNPKIANEYWTAINNNDKSTAAQIIAKFDKPFFDCVCKSQGGFDAAMHGLLELCNLATRHRRKPYYTLNDAEMTKLKSDLTAIGILNKH